MLLRWLGIIVISLSLAVTASAQTLEEEQAAAQTEEEEAPPSGETERLGDEQAAVEDETPREEFRDSTDPHERENVDYFFLGAFYRHVIVPGAFQELFVHGGVDGSNPGAGLTFNWRKNNFNVVANVWWNNAQAEGYFRAQGDPRVDMEHVDIDLGVIFLNVELLWAFPIADWFAVELGFDLGFGFVYGSLVRTEAYESTSGADDWQPCDGPGDPSTGYCEPVPAPDPCYASNGGHYQCAEQNWFTTGGDIPFIVPWIALPHFALRFKPLHQLQIRIDVAYNILAVSFGGSVSYGF